MTAIHDIKVTEIKIVHGDKWRFDFRENGYTIVSKLRKTIRGKKEIVDWQRYLHAPDLQSCLQYIYTVYDGKCGILKYDDLKDADV